MCENLLKEREAETETQNVLHQLQEEREEMYKDLVEKDHDLRKAREDIAYLAKQVIWPCRYVLFDLEFKICAHWTKNKSLIICYGNKKFQIM